MEYIRVAKACFSFLALLSEEVHVLGAPANVCLPIQVEGVTVLHRGRPTIGTLHLTPHHLIFRSEPERTSSPSSSSGTTPPPPSSTHQKPPVRPREIWITYPIIATLSRYPANAAAPAHLRLRNRDFSFLTIQFRTERECRDVFESIKSLAVVREGVDKLYAFSYSPSSKERKVNGWDVYDPLREYERMGIGTERCKGWRISKINKDYAFSPTYPAILVVPATISDTTLSHAKNYRSRMRIPALTYIHPLNNCSITRCSQPLTGVRGNRSIQDEKLVAAIFASSQPQNLSRRQVRPDTSGPSPSGSSSNLSALATESEDGCLTPSSIDVSEPPAKIYGAQQNNLIVDARPTVNAYAMQALGMGSENMENYRHLSSPPCTKTYLGIENIHVMRDCLQKVIEAIKDSDISPLPPNREMLVRSGWTKHIGVMLDGTLIVVRQIALEHSHVLIHCSDGWDRTSQLSSLAQICLDPYFRTIDGFIALVEKDWVGFGHRFRDRCGFLGSDKWFVEKSGNGPAAGEEAYLGSEDDSIVGRNGGGGVGPFASVTTAGGGLGEALEKGFGQAKMFFNTTVGATAASSNGRTSNANSSTELLDGDGAEVYAAASVLDRKTKTGNAVPIPVSVTKPKEVSPVFHQFLDATYQLMQQNPTRFEYNERFLRRLLYHLYSCQYGTFLHNNDKERFDSRVRDRTRSVWDYFLLRRSMWVNDKYDPSADGRDRERDVGGGRVLFPKTGAAIKWWEEVWGREGGEMNGNAITLGAGTELEVERSRTPTSRRGGEIPGGWPDKVKGSDRPLEVEMM